MLVEPTDKAYTEAERWVGRLGELGTPKLMGYTDEQLELVIDFTRFNRELQENHAEWLREREGADSA